MTTTWKIIPLVLSWAGIVLVLGRGLPLGRVTLAAGCGAGFLAGGLLPLLLPLTTVITVIKGVVASGCVVFWLVSFKGLYGVGGSGSDGLWQKLFVSRSSTVASTILAGLLAGAATACQLIPAGGGVQTLPLVLAALAGVTVALACAGGERFLPAGFTLRHGTLLALALAFILLLTSSSPRLDLFSPLVMKVMKFIHDFVHQFFESMLIPDHAFFRPVVWTYIGFFFSSGIGLWGGILIWFTPLAAVAATIMLEPLPSVAHIRQGAQRRRLIAAHLRERRLRLAAPLLAVLVLMAAVYQSRFPNVEYWDPAPLKVTASAAGIIAIPVSGEVELEDGRMHKFSYSQGGREVRFMVIAKPDGGYAVALDACAICKPQGYGQGEGALLCYYCKTLIPLDTVGRPGGCNPVPVPATTEKNGISIDAVVLLNLWGQTVQATAGDKGERR